MKHRANGTIRTAAIVVGLFGPAVALSAAQMAHDSSMRYDVKTEVTLNGTVEDVMEVPGTSAMSGTHVSLKTSAETIHVHLGPTTFVSKQGLPIAKGDQVSVTGSRIKGEGFEAILARIVRKGDRTMTLRQTDGKPRWSMGG